MGLIDSYAIIGLCGPAYAPLQRVRCRDAKNRIKEQHASCYAQTRETCGTRWV